ncbi:type II secretion system minor pseudopilin GspK [Ramlibacter alkalitolerans]|uniref:Type II secretion system protein K n=1 Tax=Ramlibacter alkalitolerans TaxID=2039631 RepID=A0ABS1JTD7_9BURK|nr:type II secretion system minor pseudopilin GspK [Ramlibacter alkalitolerans]MBL0427431.1 type II secretion system minor pseudopilin GspK [Ramlibacter alkalitolerans]
MKRQHGAALLAAMLTVTLVATFAAAALWQQWRSVEIESADRQRVQSTWILTGALDWARLILREDRDAADYLAEPWAVPLQEARLSTFLAADQSNNAVGENGDADQVFLSGDITDLQSRLNLNRLVNAGTLQPKPLEAFRRLFELLSLPQAELVRMSENLRFASDLHVDNRSTGQAPLMPVRVEQLVWLGLSPETVAALEPFVTLLPSSTTAVNLNTAPAEVIYAAIPNISLADAQRLVSERERKHFRRVQDAIALLPPVEPPAPPRDVGLLDVGSHYFEVRGRLRIDDVVIEERSIVQKETLLVRTLQRERGAVEPSGTTEIKR